jgi:hypothetical protein
VTISKKDQERLIDLISRRVSKTIMALVLLDILKVIMTGERLDTNDMTETVTESVRGILSRYQITEKPN